jgi:hypothetical protein
VAARELWSLGRRELARVLRQGHSIDEGALDDAEYRGVALGLPAWFERLTWKQFKKVFHRDPQTGVLRGWNVRIEQDGLDAPEWRPRLRRGEPVTFGHYHVVPLAGHRVPRGCERGLLIHYGLGENARLDPMGLVRDPIVAVNAGSAELLLGWSYVAIGPLRFGTPSYFTLEREGPLRHRVAPPRRPRPRA